MELNEEGTEVVDSKKLHKYDVAFYSKQTMNVYGGELGTGVLNIVAENEGLDSEMHLTINGGNINITSGNDGINTNEDGISVTTINGGTVTASACAFSGDSGIDADMGIQLNGGDVVATGNMPDIISESEQNYAVFSFASRQKTGTAYTLKNADDAIVMEATPENDFFYLIMSVADMAEGSYTLWADDKQMTGSVDSAQIAGAPVMSGAFRGERPEGMEGAGEKF